MNVYPGLFEITGLAAKSDIEIAVIFWKIPSIALCTVPAKIQMTRVRTIWVFKLTLKRHYLPEFLAVFWKHQPCNRTSSTAGANQIAACILFIQNIKPALSANRFDLVL